MPCTEKRARQLLERGRARVHRLVPFVIRIVDLDVNSCVLQPLSVKLDPGSKFTGIAVVREVEVIAPDTGEISSGVAVLNLFELMHRGRQILEALTARSQMRRRRRGNLRYRAPRFLNRGNKQKGWLAPSLQHRVDTTMAWVGRIRRWAPITVIASELVRFDMQLMQTLKCLAWSTNKVSSPVTRFVGTFWRNSAASAFTATPKTFPCRSSTSTRRPGAARTE